MSTTTTSDTPPVDNYDWLNAIGDHPDLGVDHGLAALALLGVETTLTDEASLWLLYDLETYGFLRAERSGAVRRLLDRLARRSSVCYTFLLPDEIVTDAELDAEQALFGESA